MADPALDVMIEPAMLSLLAEKAIPQPVYEDLIAYCPTMDLISIASVDQKIYVYRLNGQRVLGVGVNSSKHRVKKTCWKPDGKLLAAAWNDSVVRLINPDSGKIVHQISTSALETSSITCLGWGTSLTNSIDTQKRLASSGRSLSDILGHAKKVHLADLPPDLPRELAMLDVERVLPKLSVLPSGKDEDIFSSRASIDAVFHSSDRRDDDAVDVMILGFDNGCVHLTIYDSFDIGSLNLSVSSDLPSGFCPVLHASHPFSSTHALLASSTSGPERGIYFVPLQLKFISNSETYLSTLASKSTQLQNLLRYLSQVQHQLQTDWTIAQDLPTKFLRNINESLQQSVKCDFVIAAYHLVVSGNCFPPIKKWLVEELSERGHKRWDRAVTAGYENIIWMTHECLLPALERCSVVVSSLRGLARYDEADMTLGLSTDDLSKVLDSVSCLNLLGRNLLQHACSELRQFAAFSIWLRHEIDLKGAERSASLEDTVERDPSIEHAKVLQYIKGPMTKSKITTFLSIGSTAKPCSDSSSDQPPDYDILKIQMRKYNNEETLEPAIPGLEKLIVFLKDRCQVVFRDIAAAQRHGIVVGSCVPLVVEDDRPIMDMRMLFKDGKYVTYVALCFAGTTSQMLIYRIPMITCDGASKIQDISIANLNLGRTKIMDVKFVDDRHLMLLQKRRGDHFLLSVPYAEEDVLEMVYRPWSKSSKLKDLLVQEDLPPQLAEDTLHAKYARHTFSGNAFEPAKLEVNGRPNRRAICVLGLDRVHYQVFDLDSNAAPQSEDIREGPLNREVVDAEMTGEENY